MASPVHVRVLYFAGVKELLGGIAEEALELPGEITVEQLVRRLVETHPSLRGRLDGVRFARNEAFAETSELVSDGDTIAVIPPVSGG